MQRDVAADQALAALDALDRGVRQIGRAVVGDEHEPAVGGQQEARPGVAATGLDGAAHAREHALLAAEMVGVQPPHALVLPHPVFST